MSYGVALQFSDTEWFRWCEQKQYINIQLIQKTSLNTFIIRLNKC